MHRYGDFILLSCNETILNGINYQVKKGWVKWATCRYIIVDLSFIGKIKRRWGVTNTHSWSPDLESSKVSWSKAVTLLDVMDLVGRAFTVRHFLMNPLHESTQPMVCSAWPTADRTRSPLSSLLRPDLHHIWTANTSSLAEWCQGMK